MYWYLIIEFLLPLQVFIEFLYIDPIKYFLAVLLPLEALVLQFFKALGPLRLHLAYLPALRLFLWLFGEVFPHVLLLFEELIVPLFVFVCANNHVLRFPV